MVRGMKIHDAIHALILFDQKILIPRKTILISLNGSNFKFIRVDTQLNWPRLIVEDCNRKNIIFGAQDLKKLELKIHQPEITVEPLD